jgi:predicted permease
MTILLMCMAIGGSFGVGVASERRWPQRTGIAARRSLTLILYVLLPPVVFFNLAASEVDADLGIGIGLALAVVAIAGWLAWWLSSRVLRLPRYQTGAVISAVLCVNTGYLGYPLTVALLGRDDLPQAVLYDVAVTGPSLLLGAFAIGAAFGTRAGESPRQRAVAFLTRNPPLYAAVAGLLAPQALAPDLLVDASQALVVAILPIGFFAVGATLAEDAERGELRLPPPLTKPVAIALACRLAVVPALLILLAAPLIDLPAAYRLLAAMPTGLNSMIVAHTYGLDMRITAEAVTWSTGIVVLGALASLLF